MSRGHLHLPPDAALLALSQLVVVAIPEELFFRGYLMERLERVWPPTRRLFGAKVGWALIVSSALFAIGHVAVIPNPQRLAVFFPALLFGWMRARTGSIAAGALYHALCNVLADTLHTSYFRLSGGASRLLLLRLDVTQAQIVEQAGDQLLLGRRQVAPGLLLEHHEDVDGVLGQGQVLLRRADVGVLELAQVKQRRAAQRQHEGVKVDRRAGSVRRPGAAASGGRACRRRRRTSSGWTSLCLRR